MVKVAMILREAGHDVYCPWELKIDNAWDLEQEVWSQQVFDADVAAIKECDVFFMVSQGRVSTAGSNFEHGFAYALFKKCIIIQVTDEPTSLMTFCGATSFLNCDTISTLMRVVKHFAQSSSLFTEERARKYCKTILT